MQNKEWLNINKYRDYPLRDPFKGLPTDFILDLQLVVPASLLPPIQISRITIMAKSISLLVTDSAKDFVGVFLYAGNNKIYMSPSRKGCSGICTVGDKYKNDIPQGTYEVSLPIELKAIRVYSDKNIETLHIKKSSYESTEVSGDIIFKESNFITYEVNRDPINGDKLVVSGTYPFYAKCEQDIPIQQINNIYPNEDGEIHISIEHGGLTTRKVSKSVAEIGSLFDLADFNKYALTGPRGLSGDPGGQGVGGPRGEITCVSYLVDEYGGVRYDGAQLHAIYLPARYVTLHSNGSVLVSGDTESYILGTVPLKRASTPFSTNSTSTLSYFIVSSLTGLYWLDKGTLSVMHTAATSHPVVSVASVSGNSDLFFAASSSTLYLYSGTNLLETKVVGDILGIRFLKGCIHVMQGDGIMNKAHLDGVNLQGMSYYNFDVNDGLLDIYDKWIVGENGRLIQFNGTVGSSTISKLGTYGLKAIDGADGTIVIVGSIGTIYEYKSGSWRLVGSPPIKDWKSVEVASSTEVYIFG